MENNQLASHVKLLITIFTVIPRVFHPLPFAFIHTSCHSLLSLSELLAPRILLESHPDAPWLLKIDEPKKSTHTQNPPMTSYISVCVPCVCRCLSLPPQTLCRKPVSRGHSQRAPQPLWQPDLAALRKLHPATQTTHQPQQRFSADC